MISHYTKLQVLLIIGLLMLTTWMSDTLEKQLERLNNQQQLINKQQNYINHVVMPVKRIMYRNKCRNQEIYSNIMKTSKPVETSIFIEAESEFYQYAVSICGAVGLMQLDKKSHGKYATFEIGPNIACGAGYLEMLREEFHGNLELMAAAYNAGPGAVKKYGGIPPYKETINYVKKIKRGMEI